MIDRRGVLLVNLGTPDAPTVPAVRRYLKEFLSDPRVIDVPAWKRWLLLWFVFLPFRPRSSAEAYETIWTDEGSPLLIHGEALRGGVEEALDVPCVLAMRYGSPSIEEGLAELKDRGVDRIVCLPLFPQYSSAAWGSAAEAVYRAAGSLWNVPSLEMVPPFYDHPAFIRSFAARARPVLDDLEPERVVMSFHGIPERQCVKSDESGGEHCFRSEDCCARIVEANRNCYRAQCFATARALRDELDLPDDEVLVTFQSRLGKDPWTRPYTDRTIRRLAEEGIDRVAVMSPAFVADCLETTEEIGIRAREDFEEHGGEELRLVPSLNAEPDWVEGVVEIVRDHAARARDTRMTLDDGSG